MPEVTQDEPELDDKSDVSESTDPASTVKQYLRLWGVISFVIIVVWLWAVFGAAEARSAAGFSLGAQGMAFILLVFFWHGARCFSGKTSWLYAVGIPVYLLSIGLSSDLVGLPMILLLGLGIGGLVVAWRAKSKRS